MMDRVIYFSQLSDEDDFKYLSEVVLCFGHFNTIHPGHIRYFLTARQYGTPVVVALEGDAQLPLTERDRVFGEVERAQSVAALNMIDHVVILDSGHLEDLVRLLTPVALILGKEFERLTVSRVSSAVAELRAQGGKVVYDAGEPHYANAELFHNSLGNLEKERWRMFQTAQKGQGVELSEVFTVLSGGRQPQLLVVGDTIVDHFVACDPIGMSNEAPVVVVKELETQNYVGGAGIVSAHVAALGAKCTFLSVTGADDPAKFVASSLTDFGVDAHLVEDTSRPTTFKIRYLVENQKLFRVSRLKEHRISSPVEDQLIAKIVGMAPNLNGIIVSDFVYGVITPRVIETLLSVSRKYNLPLFGDLQCSSQVGNITRFQNFHLICPTEREARIALSNHDDGVEYVANLLIGETHASNLILKLGAEGFIAYVNGAKNDFLTRQHFPALMVNPVDVTGAGDALLAAMSVGLTQGLSLMEASALACCVSAIAVQTVGNRPVALDQVQNFYNTRNGLIDAV
jgi:rfaE bifunctional protein kinase chain/domain